MTLTDSISVKHLPTGSVIVTTLTHYINRLSHIMGFLLSFMDSRAPILMMPRLTIRVLFFSKKEILTVRVRAC